MFRGGRAVRVAALHCLLDFFTARFGGVTRLEPTASPILRMEGVSKRYGGVRALANADLVVFAGRIHAILGENGAGKSTLIKILAGVVAPDTGRIVLDGAEVAFDSPAAANRAGHRLHFPGAVARSRPFGRRQHRHLQSAATLRNDRPARAAATRRGSARARRRAGYPSDGAGQGPAAVAPPDGGDRQGAGAQAPRPHPRRGDLGLDRRRRRQGVRGPEAFAPGRSRAPVHLPSHARDRRTRRRMHGVQERRQCRDLRRRNQDRQRGRRDDDRARIQPRLSAEAGRAGERRGAAPRGQEPELDRPAARHFVHRRSGRSRWPRRPRRAGPAGTAAGAVRRPARRFGRNPGRGRAGFAIESARGESRSRSAWRSFRRIARPKG